MFLLRPPQLSVERDLVPALHRSRAVGCGTVFPVAAGRRSQPLRPHAKGRAVADQRRHGLDLRPAIVLRGEPVDHPLRHPRPRRSVSPAGRGAAAFVAADDVATVAVAALSTRRHTAIAPGRRRVRRRSPTTRSPPTCRPSRPPHPLHPPGGALPLRVAPRAPRHAAAHGGRDHRHLLGRTVRPAATDSPTTSAPSRSANAGLHHVGGGSHRGLAMTDPNEQIDAAPARPAPHGSRPART